MRQKIIEILDKFSVSKDFFVADGAKGKNGIIHLKLKDNKSFNYQRFAIQFENESRVISVWDLNTRLEQKASMDLYVFGNKKWRDITRVIYGEVSIGNVHSGEVTRICVMPLTEFELFLLGNKMMGFSVEMPTENEDNRVESVNTETNEREGKIITFFGTRYERKKSIREAAIKAHGYTCNICKFDFEEKYGDVGREYIEVHHIKPLCSGEQCPNPDTDMITVCANCHRMIHRWKNRTLSPDELMHSLKM